MARRTGILGIFAVLLALVLAFAAPAALAHHKADHAQGGGGTAEEKGSADDSNGGGGTSEDKGSSGDSKGGGGTSEDKGSASDSKGGGKPSSSETTTTEDNDNDGVSNTPDPEGDADNKHPSGKDKHAEAGGSGNQGKATSDPDDDGRGPERCEPVSSRTSGTGACGADQPGGTGGTDQLDQDGNNGCGNDDDFDDDNEGLCGGPERTKGGKRSKEVCDADAQMPGVQKCEKVKGVIIGKTPESPKPCDADLTMPGVQKCEKPDDVLGEIIVNEPEVEDEEIVPELVLNPATPTPTEVLGIRVSAGAQPAAVAAAAVAPAAVPQGGVLPFTGSADLIPLVATGLLLIAAGALSSRRRVTA